MGEHSVEELRHLLNRLMLEHIKSLEAQQFLGRVDEEEYRQHEQRLKRIREVSADYLCCIEEESLAVLREADWTGPLG